jgi:hypothetical protein
LVETLFGCYPLLLRLRRCRRRRGLPGCLARLCFGAAHLLGLLARVANLI